MRKNVDTCVFEYAFVKPKEARGSFVDVVEEEYIKKAITYEIVKEAYLLSINLNIHIYDYLVVLPFKGGGGGGIFIRSAFSALGFYIYCKGHKSS